MEDLFDYEFYYYISKRFLNMSDEEFWKSTPVKVGSLWELHCKVEGLTEVGNEKHEKVFIDQLDFLD